MIWSIISNILCLLWPGNLKEEDKNPATTEHYDTSGMKPGTFHMLLYNLERQTGKVTIELQNNRTIQ